MKAVRVHKPGGPENLVYEDAPAPKLEPGDALVRVLASGITKDELSWRETYKTCDGAARLPSIPGHELSGVVEALADDVTDVKVGEQVYALTAFCRDGTAAEYVAVRAADLAPRPKTLDPTTAAAVPLASLTAWQALFDHARLESGQRILIHGGAGGVGTYAVQLAKTRGAHVITTASKENFNFLRGIGADEIIDYTSEAFETKVRDLDVVLDTVGGSTLERSWQVLRKGGTLVTIPGAAPAEKAAKFGVKAIFFIVEPSRSQLMEIGRLIDSGKVRPFVQAVLPLAKAREAYERGLSGHNRGKIVLRVAEREAIAA
jgi:NADPH:quinone reductase-like Zn-dependent oxidoreductase